MTLDTLVTVIFAVLTVGGYIGTKVSERFVFLKYHDQKVGE